jgi:hypothetical protein
MTFKDVAVGALLVAGVALQLLAGLGLVTMRDTFARLHYVAPAGFGVVAIAAAILLEARRRVDHLVLGLGARSWQAHRKPQAPGQPSFLSDLPDRQEQTTSHGAGWSGRGDPVEPLGELGIRPAAPVLKAGA